MSRSGTTCWVLGCMQAYCPRWHEILYPPTQCHIHLHMHWVFSNLLILPSLLSILHCTSLANETWHVFMPVLCYLGFSSVDSTPYPCPCLLDFLVFVSFNLQNLLSYSKNHPLTGFGHCKHLPLNVLDTHYLCLLFSSLNRSPQTDLIQSNQCLCSLDCFMGFV